MARQIGFVGGEDVGDDAEFCGRSERFQSEQQYAGMRLAGPVDQFAEVFVHRYDSSSLRDRPGEDITIGHGRISVANEGGIVPKRPEQVGDGLAGADVDKNVHTEAPAGTG
jgi:hypothetical protein